MITNIEEMRQAIDQLNEWTKSYDAGIPQVSDVVWDKLYFELSEAEKRLYTIFSDSPTQSISYSIESELKKVKHNHPMLSLDKTKSLKDIKDFLGDKEWIAMGKMDGLTCSLTYIDGVLIRAETRGNGFEGEDITHNAKVLPSIPKRIALDGEVIIDGEIICDYENFNSFKQEYSNPRNFAAGSIRLLDNKECEKRKLSFIAWDCIKGLDKKYLSGKLNRLQSLGFKVVYYQTSRLYNSLELTIENIKKMCSQDNYPIDGIVFKYDEVDEYNNQGKTNHHFKGGIAYKFYDEEYETELIDIEWTMGKTGVLSPVAIYKPIEIDGATCSRSNLHNINIMKQLLGNSPYVGQKIWIYRSNMIIPQVSKAELVEDIGGIDEKNTLHIPSICPICLGKTEVRTSDSGTIELYCANEQCSGKLINKLDHFAGQKGLDIKHLSKATLEKLIDWGWVASAKDIFTLDQHRADWVMKPGFGEKSIDRLLNAINDARVCSLESFLCAISIPLIGKTYARQLAEIFESYENFRTAVSPDPVCGIEPFDFTRISGFGPAIHEAIMTYDYREADRLIDMKYIKIKPNEPLENNNSSLEGLVFCVTGKLHKYKNRDEIKALITSLGGKVTETITSKTNYLINNDINSTSAKNEKAKKLNIPIITEEEFIELLK